MIKLVFAFLLIGVTPTPIVWERGRLTIVARDSAGHPLSGIRIGLIHDSDNGRVEIGEMCTNSKGYIAYSDLPWGLYIVQFRGQTSDGRQIIPPDQQNQGLLDDGSGMTNGFGVRFAEDDRTELFVLVAESSDKVTPMFDAALTAHDVPKPIEPRHTTQELDNPAAAPSEQIKTEHVTQELVTLGALMMTLLGIVVFGTWWYLRQRRVHREHP